jgi:hypothetical protein
LGTIKASPSEIIYALLVRVSHAPTSLPIVHSHYDPLSRNELAVPPVSDKLVASRWRDLLKKKMIREHNTHNTH